MDALKLHRERQDVTRKAAGAGRRGNGLVLASEVGTELDSHDVRRSFRTVLGKAA